MATKILFHREVEKDLKKLPKNIRERFFKRVKSIGQNPLSGIPLKGEFEGSRKVRLGEEKKKTQRVTGGNVKTVLFKTKFINVIVELIAFFRSKL